MGLISHFTFVLIPRFSMISLACAIDTLRAANLDAPASRHSAQSAQSAASLHASNDNPETSEPFYDWHCASVEGGTVVSSSGLHLDTVPLDQVPRTNRIAVCGGDNSHNYHSNKLITWLRKQAGQQAIIGSLSDGAFVVAEAGLFRKNRSTIHWKCQDTYRANYPDMDIRATLMEIDGNRFSCAGGTASLDLMLHFISEDLGRSAVEKITENYFHDSVRDNSKGHNLIQAHRYAHKSRILSDALAIMSNRLDQPLSISAMSREIGTSHRSLDRAFHKHIGTSPARYFRSLRLSRAATLLAQTTLPVSEIALNCGFSTASHLGRYFRQVYGCSPGQYRRDQHSLH